MIAWTSLFCMIRSMRAFSTFRILPRIGRIAWMRGSRPPLAEPPAESPSTMKTSHSAGLVDWQSLSLPGRPLRPSRPLRSRAASRALRAAMRAMAAAWPLRTMILPSVGFSSNHAPSLSFISCTTNERTGVLPSLVLVWPSNCGSASLTEMIAVRPSRMSSPDSRSSRFLIRPQVSPHLLAVLVSAVRKPSSWVPPSWVLIVFAKVWTDSW